MATKKVLVADDEEDILKMTEKKLRENNYEVIAVSNGKDAVKMGRLSRPDLALLDIAMPDMDGYAIATALRKDKATQDIPIIFLTGKELDPSSISERAQEIGAYDFLMKPCSINELLDKIKSVIG